METTSSRAVRLVGDDVGKALIRSNKWNVAFDNAVDVVTVNRNTHTTKSNSFTNRMFASFAARNIRPSMWQSQWRHTSRSA